MLHHAGVDENFRFLVIAVIRQLEMAQRAIDAPHPELTDRIRGRDDYIDQLKCVIENNSFAYLQRYGEIDDRTLASIRAVYAITSNLENIADKSVGIAAQATHIAEPEILEAFAFPSAFQLIVEALELVDDAVRDRSTDAAEEIGRAEEALDAFHKASVAHALTGLESGGDAESLVACLIISQYLERIGDRLENIAEAIILLRMGERLKLRQFRSLRASVVAATHARDPIEGMEFTGIWGTRSGARIGSVSDRKMRFEQPMLWSPDDLPPPSIIYKEGDIGKIRDEKANIQRWQEVMPGLPPKLVEYQETDRDAVILIEHLPGGTLLEIALDRQDELPGNATDALQKTCAEIWRKTKADESVAARFIQQLQDRLDDVYRVHPRFREAGQAIDGHYIPAFSALVDRVADLDDELVAPFTVFGHGDFNLDNIIYDPAHQALHFIDLHRSGPMDYAQDVSVLLASAFRIPVFEKSVRRRLGSMAVTFLEFALRFAEEENDHAFQARLAAGLARSFMTSTRFEFQRPFADEMRRRSVYLLERLDAHRGADWSDFRVPRDVVVY